MLEELSWKSAGSKSGKVIDISRIKFVENVSQRVEKNFPLIFIFTGISNCFLF